MLPSLGVTVLSVTLQIVKHKAQLKKLYEHLKLTIDSGIGIYFPKYPIGQKIFKKILLLVVTF